MSSTMAGNRAGFSVAPAGDVNGDNLADYLIGVPGSDNNTRPDSGATLLIFGNATLANIELNTPNLGGLGIRIDGQLANARSGFSVASAGDVNGDGLADVIIGAPGAGNNGLLGSGSSYVVFGNANGLANVDLANLGSGGFRIDGDAIRAASGRSVASAGDINRDGFADIIIGAPGVGPDGADPSFPTTVNGSSFVVFGKASGMGTVDLSSLGSAGFRMNGAAGADYSGISVASAGDMNGDGFADLIIGSSQADNNGRDNSGSAHVVFGKEGGFGTVNLAALSSAGFRIDGASSGNLAGSSVASAGDVNGDGFGDVILGAPNAGENGRPASGSSYVIFGKASGLANIDLATLGAGAGFRIDGAASGDASGGSVASAGDVNGDAFSEIVIGARGADNGASNSGSSYLILGKASGFATIDLAAPGGADFRLVGVAANDGSGGSVASAGDLNGDGFADILIGADGVDQPLIADPNIINQDAGRASILPSLQTGNATLLGTTLADRLFGGPGADTLSTLGGNDLLFGRAGNDTLNGGAGTDTAGFSGTVGQYRIGARDNVAFVSGPDGLDRMNDVESVQFGTSAAATIVALRTAGIAEGLFIFSSGGAPAQYILPDIYSGPVTHLDYQLLGSAAGDIALGTERDDFFNLLGGDDAVQGGGGNDVIDGGIGSNFLTGGVGLDDFFLDGRGGTTTWATITDWEAGEKLSVFGWRPGISQVSWVNDDGTPGFKGVTMHGDLNGNGVIETSVTWSNMTRVQLPTPLEFSDVLWFT